MTSLNHGDKSLAEMTVDELRRLLIKEFRTGENVLKFAELELEGRVCFKSDAAYREIEKVEGLSIPAINELRYAGRHVVEFLAISIQGEPTEEQFGKDELLEAIFHCRRAQRDARDCLFLALLAVCRRILDRVPRKILSRSYPAGSNFEEDCKQLNRIARENLNDVVRNQECEAVKETWDIEKVKVAGLDSELIDSLGLKKGLVDLIVIFDRFDKVFSSVS